MEEVVSAVTGGGSSAKLGTIFETDLSCKIWGNVTRANDMASIAYCTHYTRFKRVNFYLLSQAFSTLSNLMGSRMVYLRIYS